MRGESTTPAPGNRLGLAGDVLDIVASERDLRVSNGRTIAAENPAIPEKDHLREVVLCILKCLD